jgi:hypothetical protein
MAKFTPKAAAPQPTLLKPPPVKFPQPAARNSSPVPAPQKAGTPSKTNPPLTINEKRLKTRQDCSDLIIEFSKRVDARAEGWNNAAISVGSAYATAAKQHSDAITNAAARDQLMSQLTTQVMFSILTVGASGAFAWLCETTQTKFLKDHLTDGVKGAIEAGIGELGSAIAPIVFTPQEAGQLNAPVEQDPLKYQDKMEKRIGLARQKADTYIANQLGFVRLLEMEKWDNFSVDSLMDELVTWLTDSDLLTGNADLPDDDKMTDELERGMWAAWSQGLLLIRKGEVPKKTGPFPLHDGPEVPSPIDFFREIPGPVRDRLKALGIDKQAKLSPGGFFDDKQEDSKKLRAWGKTFTQKSFEDLAAAAAATAPKPTP